MLLSLEALDALHGDAIIIHFGETADPKILLIDGGPPTVYAAIKARLLELKEVRSPEKPFVISMAMISHADQDHITGILDLTKDMIKRKLKGLSAEFEIKNLWFNAFDDIVGNDQVGIINSLKQMDQAEISSLGLPLLADSDDHVMAVIASTQQGLDIYHNVETLGILLNSPYDPISHGNARLVRADTGVQDKIINHLKIKVLHPNKQRLLELQKKWDEDITKSKEAKEKAAAKATAASIDKSVFNLSSIVCLLEYESKKILLTGDGRADDILSGLKERDCLDDMGKLHVDIIKMPHHGSRANMTPEFLQKITADHYVFSANGKDDNPDQDTLDMVKANIDKGTLHFTNKSGQNGLLAKMVNFEHALKTEKPGIKVAYRIEGKNSFVIDLLEGLENN